MGSRELNRGKKAVRKNGELNRGRYVLHVGVPTTVNTFNTYEYSFMVTVITFQYLHTAQMGNLKN
jgi:hypothetical protein